MGIIFGPLMAVWFLTLAVLGVIAISHNPSVLNALSPHHAVLFFVHNGWHGAVVLGAVFLVVTGGEALYADLGHFGRKPIRIAWFGLVLPCLVINYFGQGALLLQHPDLAVSPFYHLAPRWFLYPLVILAAFATIIASQAVISGAFSLTFQSLNLGYLPRLRVEHTSAKERGQIYMPHVNWILFVATAWLVLEFKSSGNLAAAYGVAVSTTMVITTLLAFRVMRHLWKWQLVGAILVTIFFLAIDLSFFGANILKIKDGGWLPLTVAAVIIVMMTTWRKGRRLMIQEMRDDAEPLEHFIDEVSKEGVVRVRGTAIYLTGNPAGTPPALRHNFKHNHVLHEKNILITVHILNIPRVNPVEAVKAEKITDAFFRIYVYYGFMDTTNLMKSLQQHEYGDIHIDWDNTTFFLGRDVLIAKARLRMSYWREKLFIFMSRNSDRATQYFHLPADRVFEVGTQREL